MEKIDTVETNQDIQIENPKTYDLSLLEEKRTSAVRGKLLLVIAVCLLFMSVEVVGGYLAHSIAILSDAAHLLSDLLGFVISLVAVWLTSLPANEKHSYGYHRAGVIGALASVVLIWSLVAFLVYFAVQRIMNLDEVEVDGELMFYVALFGLFANLVMAKVLHGSHDHSHGGEGHSHSHDHDHDHNEEHSPLIENKEHDHHHDHDHDHHTHDHAQEKTQDKTQDNTHDHDHEHDHSHDHNHAHDHKHDHHHDEKPRGSEKTAKDLNIRAAFIHILGDIIQSIGVIIAALLIWYHPEWKIADPICTFVFGIISAFTTAEILKDCIAILMETTPKSFKIENMKNEITKIDGVLSIGDLHVWSLSPGKIAMSAHIVVKKDSQEKLRLITDVCRKYKIYHSTLQIEENNNPNIEHSTMCAQDLH